MQISAIEVARLLEQVKPAGGKRTDLEFVQITPDALPKSVEPDSMEVQRVVEMISEAPDIREDIVMSLKERIENGTYEVSGEEIAEMMFRRMRADHIR